MLDRNAGARRRESAFTLLEILVACGVFAILGGALVGLMSAAIDAWNRGEASRQVNEQFQALRHQIADDLSAAILDLPPTPDFHYALDSLWDLPTDPTDPACIVCSTSGASLGPSNPAAGSELAYYEASSSASPGQVVLRIRVPFLVRAALLKARFDVLDPASSVRLQVARNDPSAAAPDTPPPDGDPAWLDVDYLEGEGIGGAETDISKALRYNDIYGNIVFIKATLQGDGAQFLRADRLRPGGRPVLLLDCYKAPNALAPHQRPTFAAYSKNGAQFITFTRTLPLEAQSAVGATPGSVARVQVVYRFEPYLGSADKVGLGTLRRAFLLPPLPTAGNSSLAPNQPGPNLIRLLDEMPNNPYADDVVPDTAFIALVPNVLHLGMSFWGPETTTWELRPELEPGYAAKYDNTNRPRPPDERWLSSRYLPEAVEVTVALEPSRGHRTTTALGRSLAADFPSAAAGALEVKSTRGFDSITRRPDPSGKFARDPRHFIKVDREWILYDGIASPTEFLLPAAVVSRGARGTIAADHAAGAEVYRGVTTVFTVAIPGFRSWRK